MSVAQAQVDMRLSEAITIYLAAGAPFGVYQHLCCPASDQPVRALLKATRAALLWPLTVTGILFRLKPKGNVTLEGKALSVPDEFSEKIWQAQREVLAFLQSVFRLTQDFAGAGHPQAERAFCTVREILERYVGLTLAAAECDLDAQPSERELELCRLAGRRGDDLLLAGRCIHRRNVARLILHQARSRTELLHALAEIREPGVSASASINAQAARHLSVAIVRFYSHVFNLLSLLEDEAAAGGVARLMDAECLRLRRLEGKSVKEALVLEEKSCRTHAPHPVFTRETPLAATNPRG